MKRQSVHLFVAAVMALLGPLVQKSRGDFELWDDHQLTVNRSHYQGILHERSGAFIVPPGSVTNLDAWDSSTVGISGGRVYNWLSAYDSSTVNISSGYVGSLWAYNSSTVNISGGDVTNLEALSSSTVTFYGQNFSVGDGLFLFGDRVLGTGMLSGEWMDGTPWAVNILPNPFTATILVIPGPAHKPFCVKYPRMDFNGDCKVDFADLAIMASSWLECNLVPESACWE